MNAYISLFYIITKNLSISFYCPEYNNAIFPQIYSALQHKFIAMKPPISAVGSAICY